MDEESKRVLGNFKSDYELWHFIKENKAIFAIKEEDWLVYRRATEAVGLYQGSLGDFIKKISDGAKTFADLLDKGVLKVDLEKAGTIGV